MLIPQSTTYTYKQTPNFYQTSTKLSCSGPDDEYIEIPGGSDSVPYTDDEGNEYDIPLDDLLEYDDDNEIEFDMKAQKEIDFKNESKPTVKAENTLKDMPLPIITMIASHKERIYA